MTIPGPSAISSPEIERPTAGARPATDAPRCDVRIVTTNEGFDALEPEWNELLLQSDATVFQSFEWLRTWWKYYAKPNRELSILVFTIDNVIVAIAPLFMETVGALGMRFYSRLQFLAFWLSDYCDIIIRKGQEEPVLTSFASHLRATGKRWDVLDSQDVNESSAVMKYLPGIMERDGLTFFTYQGTVCPQFRLPVAASASPVNSYNFRRKFRKLQEGRAVDVQLVRTDADGLLPALDAFADVHGSRWKSQGYSSAFDDEHIRAFHAEVATKFARRNWLRLYILRADGLPVAAAFHFNYGKRIYMYQANAHGPESIMKCSPGYLVRALSIADGISEGMEIFDFLRGDERYKYTEGNVVESKNYLLRTKSPAARSRFAFVVFLAHDLVKKAYDRLVREYYEYRRFNVLEKRSIRAKMRYGRQKFAELFILAYNFVLRHSHIRPARGRS
jgi:CelD/BcsL family acetyltransferase involved in cellulose biosynthesis